LRLARQARVWERTAAERMPEASGDVREIVGQPVFVPLYKLFLAYGKIFRLSFGPKSFVVISDAAMAKQVGSQGKGAVGGSRFVPTMREAVPGKAFVQPV